MFYPRKPVFFMMVLVFVFCGGITTFVMEKCNSRSPSNNYSGILHFWQIAHEREEMDALDSISLDSYNGSWSITVPPNDGSIACYGLEKHYNRFSPLFRLDRRIRISSLIDYCCNFVGLDAKLGFCFTVHLLDVLCRLDSRLCRLSRRCNSVGCTVSFESNHRNLLIAVSVASFYCSVGKNGTLHVSSSLKKPYTD